MLGYGVDNIRIAYPLFFFQQTDTKENLLALCLFQQTFPFFFRDMHRRIFTANEDRHVFRITDLRLISLRRITDDEIGRSYIDGKGNAGIIGIYLRLCFTMCFGSMIGNASGKHASNQQQKVCNGSSIHIDCF